MFKNILFLLSAILVSGCVTQPNIVNEQEKETISDEARKEYKHLLNQDSEMVQMHNEARRAISKHFSSNSPLQSSSVRGGDRFSIVLQSYKESNR